MNPRSWIERQSHAAFAGTLFAVAVILMFAASPARGFGTGENLDGGESTLDGLAGEEPADSVPPTHNKTGEELARQCEECHGEQGHSDTPDIPSIAGFSMLATMDLLDTYRMGLRTARTVSLPDGSETNMEEVANALSDEDEWPIVVYFANQPWRPHDQPFDADLARRGAETHAERCEKCHYDGGRDPESDLPLAAGQWREYLVAEFDNFDSDRRAMSDKMKEKYDTLSASDKQAIIELYVSVGNH